METTRPPQIIQELVTGLEGGKKVQNLTLASMVIMILDWLLTFEMEVIFIWKAKWSLTKWLYVLSRFMPFVDVPLAVVFGLGKGLTVDRCRAVYTYVNWMFGIGQAIADLIFTLRTWVTWGKTRRMGLCLSVCYIATWVVILTAVGLNLRSIMSLHQCLGS
ncbi:hypothetical protein P691DRAFT_765897 [Macrolepiota fuliginosa MF-IS2]|uniref:DUF6533 domain-containing protein n=1 Tax=Macrolepiota fuliginosa MF-IS2 TaxID=1400762 RepID=A0A9P5X0J9_9AGAR|nr:hypothetical protein P691DRAFT_765897 [Macrolepiota fuliginosa MF-IS2]